MFTKKKGLAAGAALVLSIGTAMTGCSEEKNDPGKDASKNEPKEKKTISVSIYDRGNVPAEEGTIEKNRWTDWISEKGPAKVNFVPVPRNESVQKFNVLFASRTAPDLILEYKGDFRNRLYEDKLIMPLDDLIDKISTTYKELLKQYPALKKVGTMPDGKLYGIARINGLKPGHSMYIRTDWLEKLNLRIPTTTDELYAVLKAFRENDPDGNGKKDTLGTDMGQVSSINIDRMFGAADFIIENNQLVKNWDRVKASVTFKKKLYDEGIIDKDFLTKKGSGPAGLGSEDIIAGKVGLWGTGIGKSDFDTFRALKKKDPNAKVAIIPLPVSPYGQFSPLLQNPVQVTGMVNADAKNPEAVIQFVDFMAAKETGTTLSYGFEGEYWKKDENGCPKLIDKAQSENKVKYTGDFKMLYSLALDGVCGQYQTELKSSGDPVDKEVLAMIKQAYDAYLDPKKPMPEFTHSEHAPVLPQDLMQINLNLSKQINDVMLVRCIVGGTSYTVDQAFKDVMAEWEKTGGKKLEEWYAKWYQDNKDKAFLTKDFYQFKTEL